MNQSGKFVISLDFELLWGVRDNQSLESYGPNILGVWQAIPGMLELFDRYGVRATFATVGMLFAASKKEMEAYVPENKPAYARPVLSPYNGHIEQVGETESEDKYHFASELISLIQKYPEQEISSHTFSHYYCLEEGQDLEDFRADMEAAVAIAAARDISLKSLVFPRNQCNAAYLRVCSELGIESYRGNEEVWFHKAVSSKGENYYRRAFRLADAYLNLSGYRCHEIEQMAKSFPFNIPSSRFLRPYSPKARLLEGLRLRRICRSMTHAARHRKVFHLWWHPHNFGSHLGENLAFLEKILRHYRKLHDQYGYESMTMRDVGDLLKARRHG